MQALEKPRRALLVVQELEGPVRGRLQVLQAAAHTRAVEPLLSKGPHLHVQLWQPASLLKQEHCTRQAAGVTCWSPLQVHQQKQQAHLLVNLLLL